MKARFTGHGPSGQAFDVTITLRREPDTCSRREFREHVEIALMNQVGVWEEMGFTDIKRLPPKRSRGKRIAL